MRKRESIEERAGRALQLAAREDLERKNKLGQYVIVWRDGRAARVPASEELARLKEHTRPRDID